ncbi:hypothetical protein OCF84_21055 (plasmid) [Shewanella xiamenensis]|uniref:hypothetical protein n=1 Tax=Shewanella xiamenensis TaxID=332186 RepID=UPI0024AD7466|nr:hypothetical protein [Shewanella xiamenensis]WHF58009.1 hypothetical protein OCF84_21055 [Shewanella xiamenensis]
MSAKSNQQRLYLFARAAYIFHQIDQSPISTATEEQRTEAFVYLFKNAFKVLANDSNSCRFSKSTYGQKISYLSLVGGDCNLTYPHGLLPYQNPQSSLQNTKQLKTIPSKEFYSELSRLLDITVERLKSPNSSFESPLNGDAILNYTAVLEKQYAHMHIDSFISCVKDSLIVMDKYTDTPTHHLELASKLSKDNIANERIKITNRSSEKLTSDGKELFEIWLSDSQTENESIFYIDFYRHQILWENKNTSDFYPPVEIRSIRNSFKNMDVGNYLKAEMTRAFTSMPTVYEDRSSFDFIETLQFIYANGHELTDNLRPKCYLYK